MYEGLAMARHSPVVSAEIMDLSVMEKSKSLTNRDPNVQSEERRYVHVHRIKTLALLEQISASTILEKHLSVAIEIQFSSKESIDVRVELRQPCQASSLSGRLLPVVVPHRLDDAKLIGAFLSDEPDLALPRIKGLDGDKIVIQRSPLSLTTRGHKRQVIIDQGHGSQFRLDLC